MNQLQTVLDAITRYRTETPLGHQPHMITDLADEAIAIVKQMMQAEPVAWLVEFENGEQELHFNETKESLGESQTPLYAAPKGAV